MRNLWIASLAAALAMGGWTACGDDDSTPTDGGTDTPTDGTGGCTRTDECRQGYICDRGACTLALPTLQETLADMTCLGNNPAPDPLPGTVTATLYVEDFEEDETVEGATVDLYFDNVVDDTPDRTVGPTNAVGEVAGVAGFPARGLIAYKVHGGSLPDHAVRTTIEYDVETPDADGGRVRALSVSDNTYRLIPTVLGITPLPTHGIVAGLFEGCPPGNDAVEGVVVRMLNGSGEDCHALNPRECYSRYFREETPARIDNQPYSSPDGLYGVVQVPAGTWTLEVRGRLTSATTEYPFDLLGRKVVRSIPDSIVIVDVNPLAEPVD
jgi:hypothetical protein